MRWTAAALTVLTLVLAGCAGSDGDGTSTTASSSTGTSTSKAPTKTPTATGTTTATSTATTTPTSAQNGAPTATLTADKLSGAAPLKLNFTLDGTDPDGDTLTGKLAIGSAAATSVTVPGKVAHTFAEAGEYKVVLTVTDGKATSDSTITVKVSVGAPDYATLCPTDANAVEIPSPDVTRYATPMDSETEAGALWIYEEANGITGLQRNDDTQPTSCPIPDLIVF